MTPFANTIRKLRASRRVLQKELADALNLDASSICQVEMGRRGPLSTKQLDQVAQLLELNEEEENQLRLDARISNSIRKIKTDVGRKKLLVVDALLENLDVLTDDQVALIEFALDMKAGHKARIPIGDVNYEKRRIIM